MQWKISHFNLGSAARILWRHELLSSEAGCKLHSRKRFNKFKTIFRHSSFFLLNLFRTSIHKYFSSILFAMILWRDQEKEKKENSTKHATRTSAFSWVPFFSWLRGLPPIVHEKTSPRSKHFSVTYCSWRFKACIRGRHSHTCQRPEKLCKSLG